MSVHQINLVAQSGEFSLEFVCTAAKGAPCRMRPADPDRETWDADDPDLIDADCWAVGWCNDGGFEDSVRADEDGIYSSVPVSAWYEEGVMVRRELPSTPLDLSSPNEGND